MTISVLVLVGVCLFFVLGYSVDQKTGQAEQGGLMQFRSFPDAGTVSVDGNQLSFKTPTKTNSSAGYHSISMSKDKYRDWNKSITLNKGELVWFNALFIPKTITTNTATQFPQLSSLLVSPDKKWIAATEAQNSPAIKLIDLRDEMKPKIETIALPVEITGPVQPEDSFKIEEWDFGSRYLLVTHTTKDKVDWIRVDRSDKTKTKNISQTLALPIARQHFAGTSGNVFFALSNNTVRKLNIDQNTISSPIATDVQDFELYRDNQLIFLTTKDAVQTVSVYKDGDKMPTNVRTFNDSLATDIALSSYYNESYASILHGDKTEIIKNPFSSSQKKTVHTFNMSPAPQWTFFSNNGQFIVTQQGAQLATYDLERKLLHKFSIPGAPEYTRTDRLEWLDDFHFWSDNKDTLSIFEFDGSNPEAIGAVAGGFDVTLSTNGKRLFSVGQAEGATRTLQSSVMIIE